MHFSLEPRVQCQLDRIEAFLIAITKGINNLSTQTNALDAQIANLTADVSAETSVEQSAITLINGIPGLIATAVTAAQAAGATPAELTALTTLGASISASSAALSAAVTANTPVAPVTPSAGAVGNTLGIKPVVS